ncbi:MAG: TldD/PmbA family protein [Candidatus Aegiribacteria sp.]|nr:TldD/PmbA family protein [Candidatus Aegiribacteria sp.]
MKKLLETASRVSDQAEVYSIRTDSSGLEMRNGTPTDLSASIQSGYAIRLLKDGRIGTAYTKNLLDREELVENALGSLKGNVKAGFSFPSPSNIPSPVVPDGSIAEMGFHDLHSLSERVLDHLKGKIEGQIDVRTGRGITDTAIVNTSGLDVSSRTSFMYTFTSLLFPNTETSVQKIFLSRKTADFPTGELDKLVNMYLAGLPEVEIPTGRMKVMFMSDAMYTLIWRLSAASSGKSFYNKISPLQNKLGEQIVSEKFTLYGDPTDPEDVSQQYFDDEGVPTRKHTIIDRGVFKDIILNLDYAEKLNEKPAGNGFRSGMWGGETIAILPAPSLQCSRLSPGKTSFEEMIASIDRGVIIHGVLGAHSGNILNGDFSVGLNPGFYVENGEIRGRVKDGMVAGNVYEILKNIEHVENTIHDSITGGKYPAILIDNVSVAAKD